MADNTVTIDVLVAIEAATKRLNSIENTVHKFAKNSETMFGKMNTAWNSFVGNLAANLATKALDLAAQAARRFWNVFVVGGIQEAMAAEEAVNKLNISLQQTGIYSEETSLYFQKLAEEIQNTTRNEDDAVIAGMSLLQSLGQLSEKGLERATKAAIDLKAGLKGRIGLEDAMLLVGKAAQGEVSSFTRYGLAIQKGKTAAESFENTLRAIEGRWGGQAQKEINTFSGALEQNANVFKNLKEAVGQVIVQNPVIVELIKTSTAAFKELTGWVLENKQGLIDFTSDAIVFAIKGLTFFAEAMQVANRQAVIMSGGLLLFSKTFKNQVGLTDTAIKKLKEYGEHMDDFAKKNKGTQAKIQKDAKNTSEAQVQAQLTTEDALGKSFGNIAAFSTSKVKEIAIAGKVAGIGKATVDTYAAANLALASAPPPFSFILAATTIAAGLANVAQIAGIGFARGGIVPGNQTSGDKVAARLNSREMVLTTEDQQNLLGMVRGNGGAAGPSVNVNVGQFVGTREYFKNFVLPGIRAAIQSGAGLQYARA